MLAEVRICAPEELGGAGLNLQQDCRSGRAIMFFPVHQKAGLGQLREEWANFSLICSKTAFHQVHRTTRS